MRPQGLIPMVLGPINGLGGSGIQSCALFSFFHLFLLPISCSLQTRSYLQSAYLRPPALMELELRKWLPVSSPGQNRIPLSQAFPECGVLEGCVCVLWDEKNAERESCELSFIWGKMKTISLGDSLSALRNCSEEVSGGSQYICGFGEGAYRQSSTHFGRRLLLVTRSRCPLMILVLF